MEQPDRIHLRDHIVTAEIGAFQSERGRTQRLRFSLSVDLRDPVSGSADHVDRILSYDVLTQAIETALADQRYNLVETLAEKIAAEVLAHPAAARTGVTVEKLDRGPGALGVTIVRDAARVDSTAQVLPVSVLVWDAPTATPQGPVIVIAGTTPPARDPDASTARRRIALLAADQAAWALSEGLALEIAETRTELEAAIRDRRPVVWAPARLAADDEAAGTTPASLAFWLAARLDALRIDFALPDDASLPTPPAGLAAQVARAAVL
ncbi:dihydroneopterin aldolase [Paracoccus salsus]|uniref:dihydroneopterin aldolase n=1 Tax=Paracoccus salsus TaxID=2911061 RepID=UPI001F3EF098|nr:dihydroneopterin aldolase [Paracoccus salsus]MCF3974074.1 dihydroneopterin aldolase [Paracoccus salsus]